MFWCTISSSLLFLCSKTKQEKQKYIRYIRYSSSMSSNFTEASLGRFKQVFDFYDRDKLGRVPVDSIPFLVRVCGTIPVEGDLALLKSTADPDGRGSCTFENFCAALKIAFDNSVKPEEAREAFKGFDPEKKGFLPLHELRYYLTTMGDALTPEEVNTFMEDMRTELDSEGRLIGADAVYKLTPEYYR